MNQKGFAPLLIIFLIVGFLAAGFGVYKLSLGIIQSEKPSEVVSTPTQTPIQTSPPDPTAEWKTYTGAGFSFKYPPEYTLKEVQKNYVTLIPIKSDTKTVSDDQNDIIHIDARQLTIFAKYDEATTSSRARLGELQTQEFENGIRMFGVIKETGPALNQKVNLALFKYGKGALLVETVSRDSEIIRTFKQILNTFEFK
jgi:hypothetical protein